MSMDNGATVRRADVSRGACERIARITSLLGTLAQQVDSSP